MCFKVDRLIIISLNLHLRLAESQVYWTQAGIAGYHKKVNMVRPNLLDSVVSRTLLKWRRNIPPPVHYVLVVALYLLLWTGLDLVAMQFELAPEVQIWYPPSLMLSCYWWADCAIGLHCGLIPCCMNGL